VKHRQDRISLPLLIALHLVPGLIFAGFFFILSRLFIERGYTGYLALLVTIPACLAPMEIGVMLYWNSRTTGRISLSQSIAYRRPGTALDYTVLPLLLFLCGGILLIAIRPMSQYLDARWTFWLPAWTTQGALITDLASNSPAQQTIAMVFGVLLSGFLAPLVEELYFRGFLLPRMEHWGWAPPVLNAFLFAVYHFYFPGNVLGIFVVFIPIAYVVMLKKNWRIGAVVHSFINLWGVFSLARLIS
jgi:membrane protease YdiL (CAAX protease family)